MALRESFQDGAAFVGIGVLLVGALLAEAIRFVAGEPGVHWRSLLLAILGAGFVALGLRQRQVERRGRQISVAVSAFDPRRGANGRVRIDQAETFSTTSPIALSVSTDLTGEVVADTPSIRQLAECTMEALRWAGRLTPGASRANLVPTMPLHLAFWLGAQLGFSHAWEVAVFAARGRSHRSLYFHATTLQAVDGAKLPAVPLQVGAPEPVPGVDSTRVALAVSMPGRGMGFIEPVMAACREANIGRVITIQHTGRLADNWATFTAAVEGVFQAWLAAPLPGGARTGQQVIFLDCPVVVALSLGARLGGPTPGLWTAYTFDPGRGVYEPFPPVVAGQPGRSS
jgi:hypothetical protein